MENIDIDKDNLKNIDIDINIDIAILKNIDSDIDIDKGILQNIDIVSIRFGISNTPVWGGANAKNSADICEEFGKQGYLQD